MAAAASRRAVYEARVWRLAYLLTGDPEAALSVVERVLWTRPDLGRVARDRLDRLVVLQARAWAAAGASRRRRRHSALLEPPRPPPAAARALRAAAALPRQALEAWVLTRLDQLDEVSVARAMDCSKTAAARSLQQAEDALAAVLGGALAGDVAALREFADGMDPAPFLVLGRRRVRRRRRWRRLAWGVPAAGVLAAGAVLARRAGVW